MLLLVYTGKEAECCSDLATALLLDFVGEQVGDLGGELVAGDQKRDGAVRGEDCFVHNCCAFLIVQCWVTLYLPSVDPSSAIITEKLSLQENSQD